MKKVLLLIGLLGISGIACADKLVGGYTKSNGTYVEPHYQTSPNGYKADNYSSQGNTNPYTGQRGYQRNEYSNPPAYNQPRQPQYNPRTGTYQ